MKNLCLFVFLFFCASLSQAQSEDISKIFEHDNSSNLQAYLKTNDVKSCIEYKDSEYSLLSYAIKTNSLNVFDELLEQDVDLDQICQDKTPLMYAVKYGQYDMFVKLVESGADTYQISKEGKSIVEYCSKYKQDQILNYLIEQELVK